MVGAVIVSTPQDIALLDARSGLRMFEKVEVPMLGVIENMAVHICCNCGHAEAHLRRGRRQAHGRAVRDVAWLGSLPLALADPRSATDAGTPTVASEPDGEAAGLYRGIAQAGRAGGRLAARYGGQASDVVVKPA